MKKRLSINGETFEFEDEGSSFEEYGRPISEEDGIRILLKTKELFNNIGLVFYLSFGTLLGAVRDKSIIKGDQDVDVFITDEEKLFNSLPYLYDNGLKIVRLQEKTLYTFRIDEKCYIDVYILRKPDSCLLSLKYIRLNGFYMPKKYFMSFSSIEFLGERFACPSNPENILKWWYGRDWMIPKSSKGRYEVWPIRTLKLFVYYCGRLKDLILRRV